jgi:hypothetical protein
VYTQCLALTCALPGPGLQQLQQLRQPTCLPSAMSAKTFTPCPVLLLPCPAAALSCCRPVLLPPCPVLLCCRYIVGHRYGVPIKGHV